MIRLQQQSAAKEPKLPAISSSSSDSQDPQHSRKASASHHSQPIMAEEYQPNDISLVAIMDLMENFVSAGSNELPSSFVQCGGFYICSRNREFPEPKEVLASSNTKQVQSGIILHSEPFDSRRLERVNPIQESSDQKDDPYRYLRYNGTIAEVFVLGNRLVVATLMVFVEASYVAKEHDTLSIPSTYELKYATDLDLRSFIALKSRSFYAFGIPFLCKKTGGILYTAEPSSTVHIARPRSKWVFHAETKDDEDLLKGMIQNEGDGLQVHQLRCIAMDKAQLPLMAALSLVSVSQLISAAELIRSCATVWNSTKLLNDSQLRPRQHAPSTRKKAKTETIYEIMQVYHEPTLEGQLEQPRS